MANFTMAEKARFYGFKTAQSEAKLEAAKIVLRLIETARKNYPVAHPKAAS